MDNFAINNNKVIINSDVKDEDILPNTKLNKEIKDEKNNKRTIIDEYKPSNNDTDKDKVNEVVLKSEFKMDDTTAMLVYKNPWVGYVGPVLSNKYKDNEMSFEKGKEKYTYVDLNVNLDKDLVVPDKLFAEFNGYSWRPLYALGIKENGEKEALNIISPTGSNLGNAKNSFDTLVNNKNPKVTFGVETKNYKNITFRMILRSLSDADSIRKDTNHKERISESDVEPDPGKSIAETIIRNMTLQSLSSVELKKLFPDKSYKEINQMVVRIAQDKAKDLADKKGFLSVTGSVEGNVQANAGRIGGFSTDTSLKIDKVEANTLELGYVLPPQPAPQPTPTPTPTPSENWNQGSIEVHKQDELPQIGSQQDEWLVALGGLSILGALTIFPKKREE